MKGPVLSLLLLALGVILSCTERAKEARFHGPMALTASPQRATGDGQVALLSKRPIVDGRGLTNLEILAVTRANLGDIRDCYQRALQRAPTTAGELDASFNINAKGEVEAEPITASRFDDTALITCVVGTIHGWSFPKPRDGGRVAANLQLDFHHKLEPATPSLVLQVFTRGQPLRTYCDAAPDQRSYIEAEEGTPFTIRIDNPFDVRVAAAVSIDGLNTIGASPTNAWEGKKWIIPPLQAVTVSGWQLSDNRARPFRFAREGGAPASSKFGRSPDPGFITVTLFRELSGMGNTVSPTGSRGGDSNKLSKVKLKRERDANAAPGSSQANPITIVDKIDLDPVPALQAAVHYVGRDALERMGFMPQTNFTVEAVTRRRDAAQGIQPVAYSPEGQ